MEEVARYESESGMVIDDHLKIATVMNHLHGSIREHLLINSKPLTPWEDIRLLIDNFFSNSYSRHHDLAAPTSSSKMTLTSSRRRVKEMAKGRAKVSPHHPLQKEKERTKVRTSAKVKIKVRTTTTTTTTTAATTTTTTTATTTTTTTTQATTTGIIHGSHHGTTTTSTKEEEKEKETKAEERARTSLLLHLQEVRAYCISVLLQHHHQQCSTSTTTTSSAV